MKAVAILCYFSVKVDNMTASCFLVLLSTCVFEFAPSQLFAPCSIDPNASPPGLLSQYLIQHDTLTLQSSKSFSAQLIVNHFSPPTKSTLMSISTQNSSRKLQTLAFDVDDALQLAQKPKTICNLNIILFSFYQKNKKNIILCSSFCCNLGFMLGHG